jgi:mutual gliding-motility protein MglA
MVLVSYSGREINAKLVYYGPGLSGKTTNLEGVYAAIPESHRGKMVSMKTKTERTLFFDFLPIQLGELSGFKTRFLLYTVPGQVYYNATRRLVLKGVDAVVFVADSKRGKMDENLESLQNLEENLKEHGLDLDKIPWVIQYNKRDLPDVYTIEELERALNPRKVPSFEASAKSGEGVIESFKTISRMLLKHLSQQIGVKIVSQAEERARDAKPAGPAGQRVPAGQDPAAVQSAPTPTPQPVPERSDPEREATATAVRGTEPPSGVHQPETPVNIQPPCPPIPVEEATLVVEETEPEEQGALSPVQLETTAAPTSEHEALREPPVAAGEDDSSPLTVERVGMRLRRWFARPREIEDRPLTLELRPERREIVSEEQDRQQPAPIDQPAAVPASVPAPVSVTHEDSTEVSPSVERLHRCREVPILIDLEPEDLEHGVTLKLKITVRRASEQGTEDQSGPWMARAA